MTPFGPHFKNLLHEPAFSLEERILLALHQERERAIKRSVRVSFALTVVFGTLFLGALVSLGSTLVQSEFWSLLTLLSSDFFVLVRSSQDFGYSLLETLPLVPLIVLLIPLVLFFWSFSLLLSWTEKKGPGDFSRTVLAHQ